MIPIQSKITKKCIKYIKIKKYYLKLLDCCKPVVDRRGDRRQDIVLWYLYGFISLYLCVYKKVDICIYSVCTLYVLWYLYFFISLYICFIRALNVESSAAAYKSNTLSLDTYVCVQVLMGSIKV